VYDDTIHYQFSEALKHSEITTLISDWHIISAEKTAIAHYHYSNSTFKTLIPMLLQKNANKLVTLHDVIPRNNIKKRLFSQTIYRFLNARTKCIIVHSHFAKNLLLKEFPFIDADKVKVLPYGTQKKISQPSPKAMTINSAQINKNDLVYLSLGYIKRSKGIVELLKAFKNVKNKSCKLLLVGKIIDDEIYTILTSYKNEQIHYLGFLPDKTLQEVLVRSDVLLNVKIDTVGETSAAVMDMLSYGKPIIATDIGSNAEVIGSAGILCPPNSKGITNSIEKFADDMTLRKTLTKNAQTRRDELAWDNTVNAYKQTLSMLS
jgi:glycosyltransferase involved in cell wall biosynthesis